VRGIEKQLIPWVQQSQLAEPDKQRITSKLQALIPSLEARAIDNRQLSRLHFCLQDNPVLLWGSVQSILAQAPEAGLSPTELETLERVSQRLLRAGAERKLSRNELEYAIEQSAEVGQRGRGLEVVSPLSAEQIRDFMTRAEQLVNQYGIPNEPYDKTAGEAFGILIDNALTVE
jgi:hypothetical protein